MTWLANDPFLHDYISAISARRERYQRTFHALCDEEGSLERFCVAHGLDYFGLRRESGGWRFREWAPAALSASLVGDFNEWDASTHICQCDGEGVHSLFLRDTPDGAWAITPGCRYKVALLVRRCGTARRVLAVPAWARCCVQDAMSGDLCAVVPAADISTYAWRFARPPPPTSLRIYEVHPGIASPEPTISGWRYLRTCVLPRVVSLGYTALLLLAVLEHGYYASFGYHVTSYFAPSARFGEPQELAQLIDEAHRHGLLVLVELVHAHASANTREGLPQDEEGGAYFLGGSAGHHPVWGSRLFDYSKTEVVRFLLANLHWFASAYRVDGFRFDAVSTILYRHRSLGAKGSFSGEYEAYFGPRRGVEDARADAGLIDADGLVYLQLANTLASSLYDPPLVTIAEDHSGMPGLCAPPHDGGVGFTYRQAMGIPPMWRSILKGAPCSPLPIGRLASALCDARPEERRLCYVECHDQALVGEQALLFLMIGDAMYTHMDKASSADGSAKGARVRRGIALHKMSRLLTCALGGNAPQLHRQRVRPPGVDRHAVRAERPIL